jgi:SAM-dependent methyltransferase
MRETAERIAGLSDDRRRLLQRLLEQKRGSVPIAPVGELAQRSNPRHETAAPQLSFGLTSASGEVKENYRRFYDAVNSQLDASLFGPFSFFLNYGYVANQNASQTRVTLPDHFVNKNSVRLVLEVIGDCELAEHRVLDVGCGRGGTVFVVKQFFRARSVQGVDLSSKAVAFCRENHRYDNVRFDEGDAEKLPFRDGEFDVVTNIESSHSYPNLSAFYREVYRVLAPGGCFCYTDVMPVQAITEYLGVLQATGFTMEIERDITENVLLSCDEVARARVGAFAAGNDPELMNNFLAAPGSQVYEDMRSGRWSYRIYRFRKAAASGTPPILSA